jgi:hypothetical protein
MDGDSKHRHLDLDLNLSLSSSSSSSILHPPMPGNSRPSLLSSRPRPVRFRLLLARGNPESSSQQQQPFHADACPLLRHCGVLRGVERRRYRDDAVCRGLVCRAMNKDFFDVFFFFFFFFFFFSPRVPFLTSLPLCSPAPTHGSSLFVADFLAVVTKLQI